jgi:hypothetical protein
MTAASLRAYAFTYIFRGVAVLAAALGNYALEHVGFAAPWLPWMVLMPAAAVVLSVRGRRQQRAGLAGTTPTDRWMRLLQKSFVLVLLVSLAAATQIGWQNAHPLILVLYGVGTMVAGRVLAFRPLVWGGAVCGLLGVAAMAVAADTQLLLIAAAMLASYVVPGVLLHAHSRNVAA